MSVTYYVALPFGIAPGQAQEMPNEPAAVRRAEVMSRDPENAGALAFKRTGNPNMGSFGVNLLSCFPPRRLRWHTIVGWLGEPAQKGPAAMSGLRFECRADRTSESAP